MLAAAATEARMATMANFFTLAIERAVVDCNLQLTFIVVGDCKTYVLLAVGTNLEFG